jgi:hypothetical protein
MRGTLKAKAKKIIFGAAHGKPLLCYTIRSTFPSLYHPFDRQHYGEAKQQINIKATSTFVFYYAARSRKKK